MPKKISESARGKQKKISIAAPLLLATYNNLLEEYVALLQAQSTNPYEFSVRKKIFDFFNIKAQLDYAGSAHISDFLKTPDALTQELPGAKDMLKKLDRYDDQSLRALAKLNSMNLSRLRKRSIRNQIVPGIAFTASLLGLLLDFQDFLAISIQDAMAELSRFNISLAVTIIIVLIIVLALVIAWANWAITTPRIGVVDVLGDICQIAMSHRNLRE